MSTTRSRLVAAFVIFATLLPLYTFSGSRLSYSIFYKPPECLPIALEQFGSDDSHRAHDDSFHLPLCLARWRNESAAEVLQYVRDYPPMWFASFQNETVCGKPGGSLGLSISSIPATFSAFRHSLLCLYITFALARRNLPRPILSQTLSLSMKTLAVSGQVYSKTSRRGLCSFSRPCPRSNPSLAPFSLQSEQRFGPHNTPRHSDYPWFRLLVRVRILVSAAVLVSV